PQPRGREVAWLGLRSPADALKLFTLATNRAGQGLTGFELMIDASLAFVLKHVPASAHPLSEPYPWYVLMEVSSGRSAEDARTLIEEILAEGFEAGLIADGVLAESLTQAAALWNLRENMSEAQKPEG